MQQRFEIGPWTFSPQSHELRRDGACVRLEQRAALALQLLCEHRGQVVARSELMRRLWGARQVSPNSLAVVIRDLRNALGDDARAPVFVETISKAGYRLAEVPAVHAAAPARRVRPAWLGGLILVVIVASAGTAGWRTLAARKLAPVVVLVGDIPNATGDKAYDALARASDGLVVGSLGASDGLKICRQAACASEAAAGLGRTPARVLQLSARLVLWSGQPDIEFVAEDARSSEVVWSGRAFGPEKILPQKVRTQLSAFVGAVSATGTKAAH